MLDPGPIPPILDRTRPIGSFTMLDAYKKCPHQMYHRYIAKDLGPFVETAEMKWGNKVHKALEERVGTRKPLPLDMQHWENFAAPFDGIDPIRVSVELKLGIDVDGNPVDFFAKDVWFRGKLDVVVKTSMKAYITDWKTGNSKYEDPFELEVGAVLLKARFPSLEVIYGNYIWLKDNRVGKPYDLTNTDQTLTTMRLIMSCIEADKQREFAKKPTPLCGWCPVKTCEHWFER